eukprot:CAMPEP_0179293578 /NCGR_PEP_ID=MMETSP0797-20121207/43446_1 /TAXON_ID=47934 /ORGANISM="Dinophysis acuminata, Strain DAEP01" /LENGTH=57 /DNA_ID=CAMNT_0021002731 /DNA_START=36 /DNA_END=206 /DNA_ORIENTATION=-
MASTSPGLLVGYVQRPETRGERPRLPTATVDRIRALRRRAGLSARSAPATGPAAAGR